MDKIRFYVPDFYSNFRLITVFHDLMEALPEYFYDNITIGAAYGCFPGSIWNGGRVMLGSCTKQEMEYVIASSVESHSDLNSISDESPVGKGLMGHKVGDVVEIHAPAAVLKLKILEIGL